MKSASDVGSTNATASHKASNEARAKQRSQQEQQEHRQWQRRQSSKQAQHNQQRPDATEQIGDAQFYEALQALHHTAYQQGHRFAQQQTYEQRKRWYSRFVPRRWRLQVLTLWGLVLVLSLSLSSVALLLPAVTLVLVSSWWLERATAPLLKRRLSRPSQDDDSLDALDAAAFGHFTQDEKRQAAEQAYALAFEQGRKQGQQEGYVRGRHEEAAEQNLRLKQDKSFKMGYHQGVKEGYQRGRDEERERAQHRIPTAQNLRPADVVGLYETLGCSPDMSDDEIKTRYRQLRSVVHPDRVASKGLPETFVTFAAEEFKRLGEAYDTLTEVRKRDN